MAPIVVDEVYPATPKVLIFVSVNFFSLFYSPKGGRFRSINETLYTQDGSTSFEMVQKEPELFTVVSNLDFFSYSLSR